MRKYGLAKEKGVDVRGRVVVPLMSLFYKSGHMMLKKNPSGRSEWVPVTGSHVLLLANLLNKV